jgi:hypothetical protein
MEYRDVEARLAELHRIHEEDMGAFRARLRVLRTMGVPDLPKVGKGARVEFSTKDIGELHLALTLGEFGLPPMRIVQVVNRTRDLPGWPPRRKGGKWLVLSIRGDAQFRDGPMTGDDLLCLAIISEIDVIAHIKGPKLNSLATWHATLDLGRLADDLADFD